MFGMFEIQHIFFYVQNFKTNLNDFLDDNCC